MPLAIEPIVKPEALNNKEVDIIVATKPVKVYISDYRSKQSIQWVAYVPVFNKDVFAENQMVYGDIRTFRPNAVDILKLSDKDLKTKITELVSKQQEDVQAIWDKRFESERDNLITELAIVPEKQARKIVLDAIIAAKEIT